MTSFLHRSLLACGALAVACETESVSPTCPPPCTAGGVGGMGGADVPEPPRCSLDTGERPQVVSISVRDTRAAALLSNGSLLCWGQDDPYGQCGFSHMPLPRFAIGPSCLKSASIGHPMGAGITWDDRVMVWGPEQDNAAGDGPASGPTLGQAAIVGIPARERVISVAPGLPMVALTETGSVYIWGDVWLDASPQGDTIVEIEWPWQYPVPAPIEMVSERSKCMLTAAGQVYCYGNNSVGKLGLPDPDAYQFELQQIALEEVVAISEGISQVCALNRNGEVWCWGTNAFGVLGLPWPEVEWHPEPVRVEGIPPARSVHAGDDATCAIAVDGVAWCWTAGEWFARVAIPPIPVRDDLRFVDFGVGSGVACGLVEDGRVYCVGAPAIGCSDQGGGKACFVDIDSTIDAGNNGPFGAGGAGG